MYFPFFKKNSLETIEDLSKLDIVSRFSSLKNKKTFPSISKITVHLAWLKNQNRGFCEVDELIF